MWWQPNKPIIEKPALIAILGGAAVLIFISIVTFGAQHWPLWRHTYTLDRYVPRNAQIYLHVDLSPRQLQRWDSDVAIARWSGLMTGLEEKLAAISPVLADPSDAIGEIGTELAFAQRTVAGQPEHMLLIKTKSAAKFAALLKRAVPSHRLPQSENIWISDEPTELFSLGALIIPQLNVPSQHAYWLDAGDGVILLSSTPKFVNDAQANGGKYRNSIGDAMAGYRAGTPLVSGLVPLENIWPAIRLSDDLKDLSPLLAEAATDPVYVELNTENEYAWGQIRNYSQRLFDRLSVSDAESVFLASRLNLPAAYRVAYLHLPLGEIIEQLTESSDRAAPPLQSWTTFAKQQLGADWAKEIAPIVATPADLILGDAEQADRPQPFLLALLPNTTEALNAQLNNLEALFRRLAGQLYPREIETTLTDGTKVTELVPDPQTNAWHAWTDPDALGSFQVLDLPGGGQLWLGQIEGQNVITNSVDLLKTVVQPRPLLDPAAADCLKKIRGQELLSLPEGVMARQNSLMNRFSELYLANGSEGNRISLMFCLALPQASL